MWWRLVCAVLGQAGEHSGAQGLEHKHQEPSGLKAAWGPSRRRQCRHTAFSRWMYPCKPRAGRGCHDDMVRHLLRNSGRVNERGGCWQQSGLRICQHRPSVTVRQAFKLPCACRVVARMARAQLLSPPTCCLAHAAFPGQPAPTPTIWYHQAEWAHLRSQSAPLTQPQPHQQTANTQNT